MPQFTGKAHHLPVEMGDIYTCWYNRGSGESVAETWQVIETKKGGWVSVVPIRRRVANDKEEVFDEIDRSPFSSTARTGPSLCDIEGDLHLSLIIRGKGGGAKVLKRIISSA
jgi:hypothetical protein